MTKNKELSNTGSWIGKLFLALLCLGTISMSLIAVVKVNNIKDGAQGPPGLPGKNGRNGNGFKLIGSANENNEIFLPINLDTTGYKFFVLDLNVPDGHGDYAKTAFMFTIDFSKLPKYQELISFTIVQIKTFITDDYIKLSCEDYYLLNNVYLLQNENIADLKVTFNYENN